MDCAAKSGQTETLRQLIVLHGVPVSSVFLRGLILRLQQYSVGLHCPNYFRVWHYLAALRPVVHPVFDMTPEAQAAFFVGRPPSPPK